MKSCFPQEDQAAMLGFHQGLYSALSPGVIGIDENSPPHSGN